MKKALLIAITITTTAMTYADSFLDLEFGRPFAEISATIKSGEFPVTQSSAFEKLDKYMSSVEYGGNNKLKGAKETTLTFYKDQLTFISVDFKATDHSTIYDALKILLQKKYGQLSHGKIKLSGEQCKTVVGDIEITLTRDDDLINRGGTVTLTAVSVSLAEAWKKALTDDKAAELGEL